MKTLRRDVRGYTLFLVAMTAFSQADRGTIAGVVKDPVGGIVTGASVQAANAATGAVHKATSSKQGAYSLADLPAGTYDVSLALPGLAPFARKGVLSRERLSSLIAVTIVGSASGAFVLLAISKGTLELIIAVAMMGVAMFMLIRRDVGTAQ